MIHIGAWVRREAYPQKARASFGTSSDGERVTVIDVEHRPVTKGHLVESIVADDAITRCGKRMRNETKPPLTVHTGPVSRASKPLDWDLCWFCDGRPRG